MKNKYYCPYCKGELISRKKILTEEDVKETIEKT